MGASTVYGVGGPSGGWADMLKLALHKQMYNEVSSTEAHEIFIFAKSGVTTNFIATGCEQRIEEYKRDGRKTIVILSIGLNNAKAIGAPKNYVSTPEDYAAQIKQLLERIAKKVDSIICVGFTPVDESKTMQKINPFTQQRSYFANERISEFNKVFRHAAEETGDAVQFLDLFHAASEMNWTNAYLSSDGLHPNDKGHRWIYEQVVPLTLNVAA